MTQQNITIVWLRNDLRLADNPALHAAAARGAVFVLFIHSTGDFAPSRAGAAARWWLHQSLSALGAALGAKNNRLLLRCGEPLEVLLDLISTTQADAVYWNRRYHAPAMAQDAALKAALRLRGIETASFNSTLLLEPWDALNSAGKPFQVFGAYWRILRKRYDHCKPLDAPWKIPAPAGAALFDSVPLERLELLPGRDWTSGMEAHWRAGEDAAGELLQQFVDVHLGRYASVRDNPAENGTSRLSPYLQNGQIGPRQIWQSIMEAIAAGRLDENGRKSAEVFLQELGWREFAYQLLFYSPQLTDQPLRPQFAAFPWLTDERLLRLWQRGKTGYPLVDAGMKQLWTTGWMHNRVRMVAASFLVKHLLQPWQDGAQWFLDTLIDADLANNSLGWQWVAGCGADAAPYFRIFNPVLQGERFDPTGAYVRQWVPALAKMPAKWIHRPWEAPPHILQQAGVELGRSYPGPIVDHQEARERALDAYEELKSSGSPGV